MEILKHQVFYFFKQDMIFVFLRDLVVCKLIKIVFFKERFYVVIFVEGKQSI
jgi:hypothetical protein